jgi:hypothetical protein
MGTDETGHIVFPNGLPKPRCLRQREILSGAFEITRFAVT